MQTATRLQASTHTWNLNHRIKSSTIYASFFSIAIESNQLLLLKKL